MNQPPMDLYDEDDFEFSSLVKYASPARSFSTASSCVQPYTPQSSGRSTPHQKAPSIDMDFDPSMGYEFTATPLATLDAYFSNVIKSEPPHCDSLFSSPPDSKHPQPSQNMDFEHPHFLGSAQSHGTTMEFANPQALQQYSFPDALLSSPYNAPPPLYSLNNLAYDVSAMWPYAGANPMPYLERFESPGMPPTSVRQPPLSEVDPMPQSHLTSNGRRRVCVEQVQEKAIALHRAQVGRVHSKRPREPNIQHLPSGTHKCKYPECAARRAFKRSEHLKRHVKGFHRVDPEEGNIPCQFCDKIFNNRRDNFKSHVFLHTQKDKKTSRTVYFPEAQAVYDELERQTKHRNQKKRKTEFKGTF